MTRSRLAAGLPLGLLCLCLLALAMPGERLIGAADLGEIPGWIAGPYGSGLGLAPGGYLALLYGAFGLYVIVIVMAPRLDPRLLWGAIGLAVAAFALAPPLLSLDAFSYISYGRLQVEGLDPYSFGPSAIPLDEAARWVADYRDAASVYGPLFTLAMWPISALGAPAALWVLKALAALAAIAMAVIAARAAPARGVNASRAAAICGLNPILLVHGVGGPHNDLLMALAMLGCMVLLAARPLAAGGSLAAGVAIKLAALVIAPFALIGARTGEARLRFSGGFLALAAGLCTVAVVLWGDSVSAALDVFGGQDQVSRYSVPGALARWTGIDPDPLRAFAIAALIAAVAWLMLITWRGFDWIRAAGWATLALLVASAYMTPWYAIWALPAAAISRDRALLAAVLAFCAFQLINAIPL